MSAPTAIDLKDKLASFSECWSPKIVGNYNNNDVMVVKVEGEFVWHSHPDTDDFFLVLDGELEIELRDKSGILETVQMSAGQMFVVPKGVEHRPVAKQEAHLLLIEPHQTPNTGDEKTAAIKERI